MLRPPPWTTRTDTLFPDTTLFRSASDSRTDPRKPDIEVLLRRGPRLRRRELPRLSKRKAIGLVERDTPIGDIDKKGQAALKLGVYVGQRMNDEANRRAQTLVDFNLPCQPIFGCRPAFEVSQSFVIDDNENIII